MVTGSGEMMRRGSVGGDMWKRMKEAGKSAREEEEARKSTRKSTREDAEEEARKSAREEDWMGERARGMCSRVKGGLWKRERKDG